MSERTQKLVSIHRKTDQDLLVLANRELDRGVALMNLAATRNSQYFAQAEKSYGTATALLSKIASISDTDRTRIELRLKELLARLDQVPALTMAYSGSFAS
jgi:hypothetical protein